MIAVLIPRFGSEILGGRATFGTRIVGAWKRNGAAQVNVAESIWKSSRYNDFEVDFN